MPIHLPVEVFAITKARPLTRIERLRHWARCQDPVLLVAVAALVLLGAWAAAPLAQGVSESSDTVINLNIPNSTSIVPGFTAGDSLVSLPVQTAPGEAKDATSSGWALSTNWANGYQVTLRASSDPALHGRNAGDTAAPRAYFEDFKTSGCPCPWSATGDRGVFGYSVDVGTTTGTTADASKWGSGTSRKWRGFETSPYELFQTPGGPGQYTMSLQLRTQIPDSATQPAGAYRANLVLSVVPLF